MPIPDVGPLGSVAGWFLAVAVMAGVVTLIVTGKLVPGPTHDRVLKLNDDLAKKLGDQAPVLTEISRAEADQSKDIEFLVDFVKETIRARLTERPGG